MNNYKIIIQNINYSPYKSKRSLFIGSVYRLLSYKAQENQKLGKNIENVYLINKETILLGDLNIDYINFTDFNKHKLIKTLLSLKMTQLNSGVTRPVSGKCLDHVWSSHPDRIGFVPTENNGLSDHLPIFSIRKYKQKLHRDGEQHTLISYRDFKTVDEKNS